MNCHGLNNVHLRFINILRYTIGYMRAFLDGWPFGALFYCAARSYLCSKDVKAPLAHRLSIYGFAAFFSGGSR